MYVKVDDGTAIYATHLINCPITDEVRNKLSQYQLEQNGVVSYGESIEVQNKLTELNVPFTVKTLNYDNHKSKSKDIRYNNRSEAVKHLLEDVEPESMVIPNLKKKLQDKDDVINKLQGRLLNIENKLKSKGII